MKISVILPTNKINSEDKVKDIIKVSHTTMKYGALNEEFKNLCNWYISPSNEDEIDHILDPTLESLLCQEFDDYEVILCHKYPDDIKEKIDWYHKFDKLKFKIKLIKEKPSIWHKLGDYPTVNNNRNTGLIHAKGELILFLDDMTIFNENLLQNAWDAYRDGYYMTARGMRRIRYDPNAIPNEKLTRKSIVDNNIYSSYNFNNIKEGYEIPIYSTWTYCCTVSRDECLKINGFDEIYDGNFGGTDQDFGRRLSKISKYKRKLIGTIYEFKHKSSRQRTRNDEMFRQIIKQYPNPKHIVANNWKPSNGDMKRYKMWHKKYIGDLDPNWNKFMDVPYVNIRDLCKEC